MHRFLEELKRTKYSSPAECELENPILSCSDKSPSFFEVLPLLLKYVYMLSVVCPF